MVLDGFWRHVLHVDIKLREGDFDMFLCKGLIDGEAQIRGRALDEGEILQPVVQGEIQRVVAGKARIPSFFCAQSLRSLMTLFVSDP